MNCAHKTVTYALEEKSSSWSAKATQLASVFILEMCMLKQNKPTALNRSRD